eukprot:TRINITY_DN30476_c0_g1_i1.p2 TRINITY_DN30476_c0_g1~~TRINITY_DN30476_c0_g1_i1.p2  ORF type:complete len:402 (+),score=101.70 TRINITY_DN30476_c0_g1_i1:32-1237(+)
MYRKKTRAVHGQSPDVDATVKRLYSLLLDKSNEDAAAEAAGAGVATLGAPAATGGGGPSLAGSGAGAASAPTLAVASAGLHTPSGGVAAAQTTPARGRRASESTADGGASVTSGRGQSVAAGSSRGGGAGAAGGNPTDLGSLSPFDLEREREAFLASICTDTTRHDTREWVGKIFNMMVRESTEANMNAMGRDRRWRARSTGTSESGASGTTLMAAGSIATGQATKRGGYTQSLASGESLVVHNNEELGTMSGQERLRAYLRGDLPELKAHVDAVIAKRSEEVKKRVDAELCDSFLRRATRQQVFDNKANFLRWENTRRAAVEKELSTEMARWIWEAVQTWDQHSAVQAKDTLVGDSDLIFDYLTKRAAHIDSGKLATEIPIFKPLMASYSLPAMWRDRYL